MDYNFRKTMSRILYLTLKKKWFDLIASGEKTKEFRDIKPYWTTRFLNKEFDEIYFKNGYSKKSPFMRVEWKGMNVEDNRYAISLGRVLEVKN